MSRTKRAAESGAPGITVERRVHFTHGRRGRREMHDGIAAPPPDSPSGRVPRVARLLALAHRFEGLLASGAVRDQAELARVAGVTRARVTQVLNLLYLAPDVQEAVLDLPLTIVGSDPFTERDLRPILATPEWSRQRTEWRVLLARAASREGTPESAAEEAEQAVTVTRQDCRRRDRTGSRALL
jgi:hypothetical protein